MTTDTLLIELGTEELPPKALKNLSRAFAREVYKRLTDCHIECKEPAVFAAPRRLGLKFTDIQIQQTDQMVEKRGPAVNAAFTDDGSPTKAAQGFARSCGVEVAELGRLKTDKGEWLAYKAEVKGQTLAVLLPEIVSAALAALPIPKRMRWGDSDAEFVRPVHWLLMMLGEQVIEAAVLGVQASNATYGHRFHAPEKITLSHADDYPHVLEQKGYVLADFEERQTRIEHETRECATQHDAVSIIDEALLDEVTALVEWPAPICGTYDEHFLDLPREVLIASMQDHQKYFPLENKDGQLVNKFITIANIESREPDAIRAGNERVIRPRLSDAKFFWDQDLKSTLDDKKARLGNIIFEKQLGTLLEKTNRVTDLATRFAGDFGAEAKATGRAAALSRADLVSEMVGEFPELQGIMAGYYAKQSGEDPSVQSALSDFYRPRFAGDAIPSDPVAQCIAVADRLDTLVGIFAIGSAPTGDKDPYALRRAALGALRILIEGECMLDLNAALQHASGLLGDKLGRQIEYAEVMNFMLDRLRGYYLDKGISHATINAVLNLSPSMPFDIHRRLQAVVNFSELPAAADLAAANKRISNILRKAEIGSQTPVMDPSALVDEAEKQLAESLTNIEEQADSLFADGHYAEHLKTLADLKDPINAFFDQVMVMSDDEKLRTNRLALLTKIRRQFSQVADIGALSE